MLRTVVVALGALRRLDLRSVGLRLPRSVLLRERLRGGKRRRRRSRRRREPARLQYLARRLGLPGDDARAVDLPTDDAQCPCPSIATSPGPLVPFDVDQGRVVAGGENATVVYDAAGAPLASIPVSPLAAQLSGSSLLVLVQGRLLDYDVGTGSLLHEWPLPDAPSGGECGSPHSGTWECRQARLVLEDAAEGFATYIPDGQVHILRLTDGSDATVAPGTLARFTDSGLVYASGATLRLVPFSQLP